MSKHRYRSVFGALSLQVFLRRPVFSPCSRPPPSFNCWLLDAQYRHRSQKKGWNPPLSGSRNRVVRRRSGFPPYHARSHTDSTEKITFIRNSQVQQKTHKSNLRYESGPICKTVQLLGPVPLQQQSLHFSSVFPVIQFYVMHIRAASHISYILF